MIIFDKIQEHQNKNLPFVAYRKPKSKKINGVFCKTDDLIFTEDFSDSGFVFSPFYANERSILFPIENSDLITQEYNFDFSSTHIKLLDTSNLDKKEHVDLVQKTIDKIKESELKKIVVSRKEEVLISDFKIIDIYKKLLESYTNAFVYMWYHPKIGLWLGATPETLLEINGDKFKTMSLAGTQVSKEGPISWGAKEIEEQQMVTDFIRNQVQGISENLSIEEAETVRAGSLLHLRSRVEGRLKSNANLKELIRALHPTPAVCGLPRESAKEFILNNENYKRAYYTGFLGELNMYSENSENSSHLFVNLRCMKVSENKAQVFVGGGITKDSDAEKEWLETVAKTSTMKNMLQ